MRFPRPACAGGVASGRSGRLGLVRPLFYRRYLRVDSPLQSFSMSLTSHTEKRLSWNGANSGDDKKESALADSPSLLAAHKP